MTSPNDNISWEISSAALAMLRQDAVDWPVGKKPTAAYRELTDGEWPLMEQRGDKLVRTSRGGSAIAVRRGT